MFAINDFPRIFQSTVRKWACVEVCTTACGASTRAPMRRRTTSRDTPSPTTSSLRSLPWLRCSAAGSSPEIQWHLANFAKIGATIANEGSKTSRRSRSSSSDGPTRTFRRFAFGELRFYELQVRKLFSRTQTICTSFLRTV